MSLFRPDMSYNNDTILDPKGALILKTNIIGLYANIKSHIEATKYRHASSRVHYSVDRMLSEELYVLEGGISIVDAKVANQYRRISDCIKEIDNQLIRDVNKKTYVKLNSLGGDIKLTSIPDTDVVIATAVNMPEITIYNNQPQQ